MTAIPSERWERIKSCTAEALDLDPSERDTYIARTCAGDGALEAEVRSLLASSIAAAPFFEGLAGGGAVSLYGAGRTVGPYRLVRELASGGMGSVYLAERAGDFDQRVAIKIVRGGFGSPFLLERFREERRILATLEHPNIARLLDGGATETGLPYVVMEYVQGKPIDQFCAEGGLDLRERLRLFRDVCAAVQYAHQHLVIHRDIKPGNILVTGDGTPKLLDFGIAKLLDEGAGADASSAPLRPDGASYTLRLMTPESASPEQVSGKPVSVAADVYALGALLYRLLTGQGPYGRAPREGADLIRAVCEELPPPPSACGGTLAIPSDVDRIVLKALRKEPGRRYASAGALSEDVQRFLEGRPVLAAPDSVRYRATKFVTRHRLAVVATAAVAMAVAAGIAATLWQARAAERERRRAQREFNAVRGFAQSVLGEVHTAVAQLPGSTPAREILLRRGTEYLDALSAEAGGDDALRREVAAGYLQLARVQGGDGVANLGDRASAEASMNKALALVEPLVQRPKPDPEDNVRMITMLMDMARLQPDADRDRLIGRARTLLASLSPQQQATPSALVAREMLWERVAALQIEARDYAAADLSRQRYVEAAEERLRQSGSLEASYNLSLGYKYRGATLEMLGRQAEAIDLYRKAARLDQQRIDRDPGNAGHRLDLSFAEASVAAALLSDGDFAGARAGYERAVAMREAAVAQDPANDFARTALARGYDRLAGVYRHLQDVPLALAFNDKALALYRRRMQEHPERDFAWREHVSAVVSDVRANIGWLATCPRQGRPALRAWAAARLDEIDALEQRWTSEKHAGALAPASIDLRALRRGLVHP